MAERATETVYTNCAHRNVCKWTEGFLKLVQMVNETQFKYGVDVDEPIKVKCREWQMQIETSRNIS